jgi:hypothetical protein
MGKGLEEALHHPADQGIDVSVVSEPKKTLGPMGTDVVSRFLQKKGSTKYFSSIVSPQGKVFMPHLFMSPGANYTQKIS